MKSNQSEPPVLPAAFKSLLWRIFITLFILFTLAGPGARLLEALTQSP